MNRIQQGFARSYALLAQLLATAGRPPYVDVIDVTRASPSPIPRSTEAPVATTSEAECVRPQTNKTYYFDGQDETDYTRGPAKMVGVYDEDGRKCVALMLSWELSENIQKALMHNRELLQVQADVDYQRRRLDREIERRRGMIIQAKMEIEDIEVSDNGEYRSLSEADLDRIAGLRDVIAAYEAECAELAEREQGLISELNHKRWVQGELQFAVDRIMHDVFEACCLLPPWQGVQDPGLATGSRHPSGNGQASGPSETHVQTGQGRWTEYGDGSLEGYQPYAHDNQKDNEDATNGGPESTASFYPQFETAAADAHNQDDGAEQRDARQTIAQRRLEEALVEQRRAEEAFESLQQNYGRELQEYVKAQVNRPNVDFKAEFDPMFLRRQMDATTQWRKADEAVNAATMEAKEAGLEADYFQDCHFPDHPDDGYRLSGEQRWIASAKDGRIEAWRRQVILPDGTTCGPDDISMVEAADESWEIDSTKVYGTASMIADGPERKRIDEWTERNSRLREKGWQS